MQLVKFGPDGLAISVHPLPADCLVTSDAGPVSDDGMRLAVVNGAVTRIADLRGYCAFGGVDGRTPADVPNDLAFVGKGWVDLAAMTSAEHPHGLLRSPRPETAAEKRAREKVEADAATAAERARIMALSASAVQFAQACAMAGIISKDAAIAWASAGTLPAILATAIDAIPDEGARFAAKIKAAGATSYERGSPMVIALGQAIGKSDAELDALFSMAVTL